MTKTEKHQHNINAIQIAMGLPSISADFNKRLNEAAKAGEHDAIRRVADRREVQS